MEKGPALRRPFPFHRLVRGRGLVTDVNMALAVTASGHFTHIMRNFVFWFRDMLVPGIAAGLDRQGRAPVAGEDFGSPPHLLSSRPFGSAFDGYVVDKTA